MNTLNRKSWGDLARHRTRTLLAAGTLAIAIASLGFLAVPGLLNAAMNRQVEQGRLNEVAISTRPISLTAAQLGALGRLPGVAAVSADLSYVTTTTTTAGATQNIVIDGGGLASATVNTVLLMSGRLPGPGEALADVADGKADGYTVPAGGTLGVRAASGATVRLRVSGTGLNLAYTPGANSTGVPVFYTSIATAQALSGTRGYNHLGFRLTDDSPAAQNRVIAEARAYLAAQAGSDPITSLPYTRAPGYWPGQTGFNDLMAVLYIITVLAFGSALFLIAATMNTAHRRAGPRDRHPQGARRPAAADRRHHRPHRGDARPGRRDRRRHPRRRGRLPAGPLLRRADRRRVVRLRRVGPGHRGQPGGRPGARGRRVAARPAAGAAQAGGRDPHRSRHGRGLRGRLARPDSRARPTGRAGTR